jgi:hypothetical protein
MPQSITRPVEDHRTRGRDDSDLGDSGGSSLPTEVSAPIGDDASEAETLAAQPAHILVDAELKTHCALAGAEAGRLPATVQVARLQDRK